MQTDEIRRWKQATMKLVKHLDHSDCSVGERAALLSAVAQWEIALQLSLANRREGFRSHGCGSC